MKVSVNKDRCTGCGLCTQTCPEVFEMAPDNIVAVRVATVSPEQYTTCREAAAACPVDAIDIQE